MTDDRTEIHAMKPAGEPFLWRDAGRDVRFGAGELGRAPATLAASGWDRFELVTTERALGSAPPGLVDAASAIHLAIPGGVPDAAERILGDVGDTDLVAFGGGRAIDVAKAVAAVRGGRRVAAIPTTLSGAEMTAIHRLPPGVSGVSNVRPALVVADPEAMTTLPEPELRASAMNSLAHGAEALWGPRRSPVASAIGAAGVAQIAAALDPASSAFDPIGLAWGSILCAAAVDSAGLGPHHAICQTLVRVTGSTHAETNAAMLPLTLTALARRHPDEVTAVAAAIGTTTAALPEWLAELSGGRRTLTEAGADRDRVDDAIAVMGQRQELSGGHEPFAPDELRALIESAW